MDSENKLDYRPVPFIAGLIDFLSRGSFFLCQTCTVVVLAIVFISIITRYGFNYVLEWTDEVVSYLFIFSVFFGIAEVMRRRGHISVDLLVSGVSNRKNLILELFILIVSLFWCSVMGWQAWKVTLNAYKFEIISSTLLRFPLYISYSFLAIGLTLLLLQILMQMCFIAGDLVGVPAVKMKKSLPLIVSPTQKVQPESTVKKEESS